MMIIKTDVQYVERLPPVMGTRHHLALLPLKTLFLPRILATGPLQTFMKHVGHLSNFRKHANLKRAKVKRCTKFTAVPWSRVHINYVKLLSRVRCLSPTYSEMKPASSVLIWIVMKLIPKKENFIYLTLVGNRV